jgi:predicted GNAT superfamily acetyltransferase
MMNPILQIRPATVRDLPEVLRLNQPAFPHVSSLTSGSLRNLFDEAAWFYVAVSRNDHAGFLIALRPDAAYQSENYLWFAQRFPNFLYIDRICVCPSHQRRGVGSRLYAGAEKFARESHIPLLTCEVNLEPENPTSLAFHDRLGFQEVDTQRSEKGTKLVSLRLKHLRPGASSDSHSTGP